MCDGPHDEVALGMLACLIGFVNKTENWKDSRELLELSLSIVASESARGRIQENIEIVKTNFEFGTCWFCQQNSADASAAIEVKMYGDVKTESVYDTYPVRPVIRTTWRHGSVKVPRCKICQKAHSKKNSMEGAGRLVSCLALLALLRVYGSVYDTYIRLNPLFGIGGRLGVSIATLLLGVLGVSWTLNLMTTKGPVVRWITFTLTAAFPLSVLSAFAVNMYLGWPDSLFPLLAAGAFFLYAAAGLPFAMKRAHKLSAAAISTKPEITKNEYPQIQTLLGEGWQFGDKPP